MASSEYLFIQPLLGATDEWSGYLVEPGPGEANGDLLQGLRANPQFAAFDQRNPWLLPAMPEVASGQSQDQRLVVVFPARPAASAEEQERLARLEADLRRASRKVGLLAAPEIRLPAAGAWDYLLLGASQARTLPPFALLGLASRTVIVAIDVHSHTDRGWLLEKACSLSTGEFLLTRSKPDAKADTTRIKLLELLGLIADDAETARLEAIFRQEPKLSYSLLRLVNSAAMAPRSPITSFAQAINLLGRRQLQRWLQLLVYADPNNGSHPNPLLQKAAARGRLLELLAPRLADAAPAEDLEDTAFMIGAFSLLDVLLNMSMPEILQQLPLSELVRAALAEHAGPLGELLQAVDSAEARDFAVATRRLAGLGIAGGDHLASQLEALSWAAKIRPNS